MSQVYSVLKDDIKCLFLERNRTKKTFGARCVLYVSDAQLEEAKSRFRGITATCSLTKGLGMNILYIYIYI